MLGFSLICYLCGKKLNCIAEWIWRHSFEFAATESILPKVHEMAACIIHCYHHHHQLQHHNHKSGSESRTHWNQIGSMNKPFEYSRSGEIKWRTRSNSIRISPLIHPQLIRLALPAGYLFFFRFFPHQGFFQGFSSKDSFKDSPPRMLSRIPSRIRPQNDGSAQQLPHPGRDSIRIPGFHIDPHPF